MRFRAEFENFSGQDAASARLQGFLPFTLRALRYEMPSARSRKIRRRGPQIWHGNAPRSHSAAPAATHPPCPTCPGFFPRTPTRQIAVFLKAMSSGARARGKTGRAAILASRPLRPRREVPEAMRITPAKSARGRKCALQSRSDSALSPASEAKES
jgi:hypothetical protein